MSGFFDEIIGMKKLFDEFTGEIKSEAKSVFSDLKDGVAPLTSELDDVKKDLDGTIKEVKRSSHDIVKPPKNEPKEKS